MPTPKNLMQEKEDKLVSQLQDASINTVEVQAKAKWLEEMLIKSIDSAGRKRDRNMRKASWVKIATIVLAGMATIFLGLQLAGLEKLFKELAFVFSAIVTLVAAIEPFYNWRALWVEHESALAEFHRTLDELRYYLAGREVEEIDIAKVELLFNQYQEVWTKVSNNWIEHRQSSRYNI